MEQVAAFLRVDATLILKTIIAVADGKPVAALVRGDRELNLPKFARFVGAKDVELADAATVVRVTGAPVGFAGPVDLAEAVPIYVDNEVADGENYVVGANQADAHRTGVAPGAHFAITKQGDIRTAVAGDKCPRCEGGHLTDARGIEVGHIFKLGHEVQQRYERAFPERSRGKASADYGMLRAGREPDDGGGNRSA